MKLWKYNNVEDDGKTVLLQHTYKTPFIYQEVQPNVDYSETTNLVDWFTHFNNSLEEYSITKQFCKEHLNTVGWSNLSDQEKQVVIDLDLSDPVDTIPFLMGKGYSLEQAKGQLVMAFSKDHIKNVQVCQMKMNDEYLYVIIGKHLNMSEAASFFTLTQDLSAAYERQALKGTLDSPGMGEGLFDFIESTPGTSYELAGIASQGFITNSGNSDVTPLVNDLMNWFRYHKKD